VDTGDVEPDNTVTGATPEPCDSTDEKVVSKTESNDLLDHRRQPGRKEAVKSNFSNGVSVVI